MRRRVGENPTVQRADRETQASDFSGALDWLLAEARRGMTIQRYKGLGEMNADQLWNTTMDPEVRTLLQVSVNDAALADETFTTLMGDIVEPRRNYITTHALEVKNLDV